MKESTGDRIKHFRQSRNLTQSSLGKLVGVKNNTVSQWENGTTNPNIDFIEKLCVALKITPSMLLGFEDEDLEIKLKEYLRIYDGDHILESYASLIPDFKHLVKSLIDDLNKLQIDLEINQPKTKKSLMQQYEEYEEPDLLAAHGSEGMSKEELELLKEEAERGNEELRKLKAKSND